MKFVVSFFLFFFWQTFSCAASTAEDFKFEKKLENISSFFDKFCSLSSPKFEEIAMLALQYDELSYIFTEISEFPSSSRNHLLHEMLNPQCDQEFVLKTFYDYFNATLLPRFTDILDKHPELNTVIIDLFESIKITIKTNVILALQSVTKQAPTPTRPIATEMPILFPLYEDEEKENAAISTDQLIPANQESAFKLAYPLQVYALVVLSYGLDPNHSFYNVACSYIDTLLKCDFNLRTFRNLINPQYVFDFHYYVFLKKKGFDAKSSGFSDFRSFVANNAKPITSVLYQGEKKSIEEIRLAKQNLLNSHTSAQIREVIDTFDNVKMNDLISWIQKIFSVDSETLEILIEVAKESVSQFLLEISDKGEFSAELESKISSACLNAVTTLNSDHSDLPSIIAKEFMKIFNPLFELYSTFIDVDIWEYLFKPKCKALSFAELRKKEEEDAILRHSIPLQRAFIRPSLKNGLSELNSHSSESLKKADPLRTDAHQRVSFSKPVNFTGRRPRVASMTDVSRPSVESEYLASRRMPPGGIVRLNAIGPGSLSSTEEIIIPDFPFQDSRAAIEDGSFIKSTAEYFMKNGDNSRFNLSSRIEVFKIGASNFVHESFSDSHVADSLEEIISGNVDSLVISLRRLRNQLK
jgi:hypothetical protein